MKKKNTPVVLTDFVYLAELMLERKPLSKEEKERWSLYMRALDKDSSYIVDTESHIPKKYTKYERKPFFKRIFGWFTKFFQSLPIRHKSN